MKRNKRRLRPIARVKHMGAAERRLNVRFRNLGRAGRKRSVVQPVIRGTRVVRTELRESGHFSPACCALLLAIDAFPKRNSTTSPSADYRVPVAGRVAESGSRDAYHRVSPASRPNGARTTKVNRAGFEAREMIDSKSEA